ncbi:reverse transcriptase domain-containing protein [Tanacetum coccineum]
MILSGPDVVTMATQTFPLLLGQGRKADWRMLEWALLLEPYKWYLDIRCYGTVEHSGFGLCFNRMVLFATGVNYNQVLKFVDIVKITLEFGARGVEYGEENDDTSSWGNSKRKEKGEGGPEWIVRSKFEEELANFMLEKKSQAKGIRDVLIQHREELREQYSQILSTINKSETPKPKASTFAITTRSGISTQDPPFPARLTTSPRGKPKKKGMRAQNQALYKNSPLGHPSFTNLPRHQSTFSIPTKDGAKVLKDLLLHKEKLEKVASLVKLSETEEEEEEDSNKALIVSFYPRTEPVKPLKWNALKNQLKPSSVEPPKLELKELPKHLEYAFLQENNQLLVVISSALSTDEKTRLLEVLRNHKGAIAWSIADIKGINSSFYTHKILMSVGKPCPGCPKEGRNNRSKNEKDELIPQRTVTGWRTGFLDTFKSLSPLKIKIKPRSPVLTGPSYTNEYPSNYAMPQPLFQRCMTAIFHELIEDSMEVFMDDFSVFGSYFDHCLKNLEKMLKRYEETNLELNWEKCHFMVKEGIVLGHKVSGSRIEVDKAKIEAISKLPYPTNVKAIRSFLGYTGFYRRFIKDLSQIAHPMTQLLVKDAPFNFSKECIQAFDTLKRELTQAPIMIKPDWSLPFEIMCDAKNYTTTEKELLAIIFAFDKFCQYLVLSKTIVFTDHSALLYLFTKQDAKPRLIRWILLLQEFYVEIRDKKGAKNLAADHLSRLEHPDLGKLTRAKIRDLFPEERLMAISDKNNKPCVPTESYEDAWLEMKQQKFFYNGIDFMGPFPSSNENKYILVAIDYVLKWVEAQAFPTSEARNVVNFLKRLFARFRIPKALISDRAYHPQTNGQVKNTNRAIKRILEKTIRNNMKDWSYKLDDALWAFRTAFKTPLGMTLFRIIYDKACNLPIKLEHKAYWAIKNCNMDLTKAGENQFLQINELDEMRLDAYESSISYKERTKRWHHKRIKLPIKYEKGDMVLLFNLRLRLFPGKLKSRWYGPFSVSKDMKNGAIELYDEEESEFIVNKQRVKPYQKNLLDTNKDDDVTLDDEGEVT